MSTPLWMETAYKGSIIGLSHCRNCGKVKALSDPCSLDHLAALMGLRAYTRGQ